MCAHVVMYMCVYILKFLCQRGKIFFFLCWCRKSWNSALSVTLTKLWFFSPVTLKAQAGKYTQLSRLVTRALHKLTKEDCLGPKSGWQYVKFPYLRVLCSRFQIFNYCQLTHAYAHFFSPFSVFFAIKPVHSMQFNLYVITKWKC